MKRIAALALTAAMTLSLAACGGGSSKENTVNSAEDLPYSWVRREIFCPPSMRKRTTVRKWSGSAREVTPFSH